MPESYPDFFHRVTGQAILPYQARYGENPFSDTLLIVPTGLGKTDSVLLPWLHAAAREVTSAPTRLIIVLPRQNLTIQTAENARARVAAANLADRIHVLELMAGSKDNDRKLRPNQRCIIVCTQDMYFSRALNRGYARRAPRWPLDFALYNQDCLIVLDEIQLMDDALATSRQLAAFRKQFGIYGSAPSVWMSATVNTDWLLTVDSKGLPPTIRLGADDRAHPLAMKRFHAAKWLGAAPEECRDARGCAAFALKQHRPGTRTLIVANTVARAREIYGAVRAQFPGAILIHSRFRPADRKRAAERLGEREDQIVVATQVLEAGVDITARLLITDIAPWGSMVQRFGRVNRYGGDVDAEIRWIDEPKPASAKQKNPFAPYAPEEIARATERIRKLSSASPAELPGEDGPEPWRNVLRRADLLDLFDTTPDLAGNEMDVSRFIRDTEDKDAYVAWRDWEGDGPPPPELKELTDEELCPVPLGELREFISKKHTVYSWNFATERWNAIDKDRLYAGMLAVTRTTEGGYTETEGWSPESKEKVAQLSSGEDDVQGDSSDRKTWVKYEQTLLDHTSRVVEELEVLLAGEKVSAPHVEALRRAAIQHDWGKAHPVFQRTLDPEGKSPEPLAKQVKSGRHERRHFRHELASALAMLATRESDLAAYLAAAHHGRVRLGIRSMPGEAEPDQRAIARGIHEGDRLPACELARGVSVAEVELSLKVMQFGAEGGSWTDRMLRLRDEVGPFRLAYLEMLLRMADEEASENPNLENAACTQ